MADHNYEVRNLTPPQVFEEDDAPKVTMSYQGGVQAFQAKDVDCGMMIAPGPIDENATSMVAYVSGSQLQMIRMVLASLEAAKAFNVFETLRMCMIDRLDADEILELLREQGFMQ